MASSCTRPPCAPQYARSARLGGRSERAALLEPRPAGARSVRGGWWERRGGAARAARDRVGRVGGFERSAGRLDSAGRLRRHGTALTLSTARRWPLARLLPVQARAGTGPFGADVTFLVGSISSRRSIGPPSRSLASPSGGIPVPQPAPQSPACSLLPACARTYAVLTGLPSHSGGRRSEVRATRSTTLALATRALPLPLTLPLTLTLTRHGPSWRRGRACRGGVPSRRRRSTSAPRHHRSRPGPSLPVQPVRPVRPVRHAACAACGLCGLCDLQPVRHVRHAACAACGMGGLGSLGGWFGPASARRLCAASPAQPPSRPAAQPLSRPPDDRRRRRS